MKKVLLSILFASLFASSTIFTTPPRGHGFQNTTRPTTGNIPERNSRKRGYQGGNEFLDQDQNVQENPKKRRTEFSQDVESDERRYVYRFISNLLNVFKNTEESCSDFDSEEEVYEEEQVGMEEDVKDEVCEQEDNLIKTKLINFWEKDHPKLKKKYEKNPENFKFSYGKKLRFEYEEDKMDEIEYKTDCEKDLEKRKSVFKRRLTENFNRKMIFKDASGFENLSKLQQGFSPETTVMVVFDDDCDGNIDDGKITFSDKIIFAKVKDLPIIFNGEASRRIEAGEDDSVIDPYEEFKQKYISLVNMRNILEKRRSAISVAKKEGVFYKNFAENNANMSVTNLIELKQVKKLKEELDRDIEFINKKLSKQFDYNLIGSSKLSRSGGYVIVAPKFLDMVEFERLVNGQRIFDEDVLLMGLRLPRNNKKSVKSSKIDLRGLILRSAILIGADLSNTDLSESYLGGSDLTCVNLSDSDLINSILMRAILINANLSNSNLSYSVLSLAILINANLFHSTLIGLNLIGADLTCASLPYSNLTGSDLSFIDLTCADLSYSALGSGTNLSNGILVNTNLFKATIEDIIAVDVRIENGTSFEEAVIQNVEFNTRHALRKISFLNATINGISFVNCILDDVNMRDVKVNAMILNNTRLNKVDFWRAVLNNLYSYNTDDFGSNINFESAKILGGVFLGRTKAKTTLSNSNFTRAQMPNTFWGNFRYKNCVGLDHMSNLDQSTFANFDLELKDGSKQTGVCCFGYFCGRSKDEIVKAMKSQGVEFNKYIDDDFKSVRDGYQNGWVGRTGLRVASIMVDSAISGLTYGVASSIGSKLTEKAFEEFDASKKKKKNDLEEEQKLEQQEVPVAAPATGRTRRR